MRFASLSVRALVLAAALTAGALAASPQITAVRFWSLGETTRVAIQTDSEATYHADRLDHPDRVFLDLAGVRRQAGTHGLQVIPVNDRLIKQIRIALPEPGITRVVLDLAAPVEYSISQLADPNRIMIELRLKGHALATPPVRSVIGGQVLEPEPAVAEPSPTPAPKAVPTPVATPVPAPQISKRVEPPAPKPRFSPTSERPRPKPEESATLVKLEAAPPKPKATPIPDQPEETALLTRPEATPKPELPAAKPKPSPTPAEGETALAAKRDSHGDRSLIRALGLKLDRVVIDPGHGGHDTGTIGPSGLLEKDVVLDVALRLGALISQRLGSEVIYTRSDDTFIPLEERTRLANEKKADLFISIHANSSRVVRIAGSETFYLNFTTSEDALEVAARENSTSQTSIHELQTLVQKIALNEKVQESRELASIVQKAMYANLPRNKSFKNRGIKKAPFVVLIGAQMPSVLAEIAFISNPKDEALLKKPAYREKVAEALFHGVSEYADALSHLEVARQRQSVSQTQ